MTAGLASALRSTYVRHVMVLMSGTAAAQVFTIAATPLLTRFFDPVAFGTVGVFATLAGVLAVISTGRYELAIVLPRDDETAANLTVIALALVSATVALSVCIVASGGLDLAARMGGVELGVAVWLVPPTVLAMGVYQTLNFWSTRRQHFSRLAVSRMTRSCATVTSQLAAGVAGSTGAGLVVGQAAGHGLAAVVLSALIWCEDRRTIGGSITWWRLRHALRSYVRFPLFSAPQALINSLSQSLPVFLTAAFFGPAVAGAYWFTHRLLMLPNDLIGQSVRQVFFQRVNALQHTGGDVGRVFRASTLGLAAAGLVPLALLLAAAPQLFGALFGPEWNTAGVYARWLALSWFAGFVNPPAVMLVHTYGLQRAHTVFELLLLVVRLLALVIAWRLDNPLLAMILLGLSGCVFHLALVGYFHVLFARSATGAVAGELAVQS